MQSEPNKYQSKETDPETFLKSIILNTANGDSFTLEEVSNRGKSKLDTRKENILGEAVSKSSYEDKENLNGNPNLDKLRISDKSKPVDLRTFKSSVLWNWFIIDPEDHTNGLCQIVGCSKPLLSRGTGGAKLTNSNFKRHLQRYHHEQFEQYLKLKQR